MVNEINVCVTTKGTSCLLESLKQQGSNAATFCTQQTTTSTYKFSGTWPCYVFYLLGQLGSVAIQSHTVQVPFFKAIVVKGGSTVADTVGIYPQVSTETLTHFFP